MGYFDDDFYNEPSEFDKQVDEFKGYLRKAVKQEIQDELQQLRDENIALTEFKKQKEKIEQEHRSALYKFECDKERFQREVKTMRLTELLGDMSFKMWFAAQTSVFPDKCDACDKNRYIAYKTPSGRTQKEKCTTCGKSTFVYIPEEVEAYRFTQYIGGYGYSRPCLYFMRKEGVEYDMFEECGTIYSGEPFEMVSHWSMKFPKKEDCQKFCDWKNNQK